MASDKHKKAEPVVNVCITLDLTRLFYWILISIGLMPLALG